MYSFTINGVKKYQYRVSVQYNDSGLRYYCFTNVLIQQFWRHFDIFCFRDYQKFRRRKFRRQKFRRKKFRRRKFRRQKFRRQNFRRQ